MAHQFGDSELGGGASERPGLNFGLAGLGRPA